MTFEMYDFEISDFWHVWILRLLQFMTEMYDFWNLLLLNFMAFEMYDV